MTQQQKEVDFNFLTKNVNKLHEKIEKKSFKKLAFIGLAIGFGAFSAYGFISGGAGAFSSLVNTVQHNRNQEVVKISKNIKAISPEEFKNFLSYMKLQQNIYDDKVSLVADSIVQANKNSMNSANVNFANALNKDLTTYKSEIGDLITQHQEVYRNITNNDINNISLKDIKSFMNSFSAYTANIPLHNKPLEDSINSNAYIDRGGNKTYNDQIHLYEKLKELDKSMEAKITSVKPKM